MREKCDSGREGDVVDEIGNANGNWGRQSKVGMSKDDKGKKSQHYPLVRSEDDSASCVDSVVASGRGGVGNGRSSSFMYIVTKSVGCGSVGHTLWRCVEGIKIVRRGCLPWPMRNH